MQNTPLIIAYIIDDDKLHQFGMHRMFKHINIPIHLFQFYNGLQALEHIKAHLPQLINLPDVIFLDVNMPVMNGWDFLDAFIQLKPLMPSASHRTTIYMITSSISDTDVEKAATYSEISEYIVKPAGVNQVKEILKDIQKIQASNII